MCDRDDANLRHFRARAQEPKVVMGKQPMAKSKPGPYTPDGINVNVFVFDSGLGSTSDQMDATRFNYVGTSPAVSTYQAHQSKLSNQRSRNHECMRTGFSA